MTIQVLSWELDKISATKSQSYELSIVEDEFTAFYTTLYSSIPEYVIGPDIKNNSADYKNCTMLKQILTLLNSFAELCLSLEPASTASAEPTGTVTAINNFINKVVNVPEILFDTNNTAHKQIAAKKRLINIKLNLEKIFYLAKKATFEFNPQLKYLLINLAMQLDVCLPGIETSITITLNDMYSSKDIRGWVESFCLDLITKYKDKLILEYEERDNKSHAANEVHLLLKMLKLANYYNFPVNLGDVVSVEDNFINNIRMTKEEQTHFITYLSVNFKLQFFLDYMKKKFDAKVRLVYQNLNLTEATDKFTTSYYKFMAAEQNILAIFKDFCLLPKTTESIPANVLYISNKVAYDLMDHEISLVEANKEPGFAYINLTVLDAEWFNANYVLNEIEHNTKLPKNLVDELIVNNAILDKYKVINLIYQYSAKVDTVGFFKLLIDVLCAADFVNSQLLPIKSTCGAYEHYVAKFAGDGSIRFWHVNHNGVRYDLDSIDNADVDAVISSVPEKYLWDLISYGFNSCNITLLSNIRRIRDAKINDWMWNIWLHDMDILTKPTLLNFLLVNNDLGFKYDSSSLTTFLASEGGKYNPKKYVDTAILICSKPNIFLEYFEIFSSYNFDVDIVEKIASMFFSRLESMKHLDKFVEQDNIDSVFLNLLTQSFRLDDLDLFLLLLDFSDRFCEKYENMLSGLNIFHENFTINSSCYILCYIVDNYKKNAKISKFMLNGRNDCFSLVAFFAARKDKCRVLFLLSLGLEPNPLVRNGSINSKRKRLLACKSYLGVRLPAEMIRLIENPYKDILGYICSPKNQQSLPMWFYMLKSLLNTQDFSFRFFYEKCMSELTKQQYKLLVDGEVITSALFSEKNINWIQNGMPLFSTLLCLTTPKDNKQYALIEQMLNMKPNLVVCNMQGDMALQIAIRNDLLEVVDKITPYYNIPQILDAIKLVEQVYSNQNQKMQAFVACLRKYLPIISFDDNEVSTGAEQESLDRDVLDAIFMRDMEQQQTSTTTSSSEPAKKKYKPS